MTKSQITKEIKKLIKDYNDAKIDVVTYNQGIDSLIAKLRGAK